MQHHLDEISANTAPDAHAILVLDQAGWHTTGKLKKPANIIFPPLPPKSPELNPAENVREYLRGRWLSNRIFKDYDAILDAVCDAWNRLIDEPARVASNRQKDVAYHRSRLRAVGITGWRSRRLQPFHRGILARAERAGRARATSWSGHVRGQVCRAEPGVRNKPARSTWPSHPARSSARKS
jgi:hypothetical protein